MLIRTALAVLLLLPAAALAQEPGTAMAAAVRIFGTRGGTPVRGSGFVVSREGDKATIVTASHVIEGTQQLRVTFAADRTESFPAGAILGMDAGNPNGLAAFQVRGALPPGVVPLAFEVAGRPGIGDSLFLLGYPEMEVEPRMSQRSLSARRGTLLLIDQEIGEGFSGGAVLQNGKVVGMVTVTDGQTTYAVSAVVVSESLAGWGVQLAGSAPPAAERCIPGEKRQQKGIVFVRICPGTFIMGAAENDPRADAHEKPAHSVTLSGFWIGETEVTNKQYRLFRPHHPGQDGFPATSVLWADAAAACESFGGRLPTEAEWEYAARAGSQTAWSFGDDEKMLHEYAWYGEDYGEPHAVKGKKPNAWGLYDLYGNVFEWIADWYEVTYSGAEQSDPSGPPAGRYRTLRGGSYASTSGSMRSSARGMSPPEGQFGHLGFRCALSPHL